jgi:hypothetical protein
MKNQTITPFGAGIAIIHKDSQKHLGMLVSGKKKNYALTQFATLKKEPGIIVDGNEIKEWYITGVTEQEENTYFYGPYQEGRLLYDIIKDPKEENLPYLLLLAKALSLLHERSQDLPEITANSILFLSGQRVMFLPAGIISKVTPQLPEEERLLCKDLIHHPDLHGEEASSSSIGILSYLFLTGEYPIYETDEEQRNEKIRNFTFLSPVYKDPEVKPDVSEFVQKALLRTDLKHPVTLEEWVETLDVWTREGVRREITEEERDVLRSQAAKIVSKAEKSFSIKRFLEKNKITIIISVVGAVAGIWFLTSLLGNILEPPVTVGMEPREVVRLFYTSMNTLDHMTMQDCVSKKTVEKRINDVIQLYVAGRMRSAYEGELGIIPANEWEEQGRPELALFETVFGVTELSISERFKNEEEARYFVSYKKFQPIPDQRASFGEAQPPPVGVFAVQEDVYVANRGRHWEIYRIDTVKRTEVELIQPGMNQEE